jgi:hypothetical protein
LHYANEPKLTGLLRTGLATWVGGASRRRQGRALGRGGVGGGPFEFRRLPAMRCSGEGPRSKAVGWWARFEVMGRKKLTRRMSSTMRCGRPEGNGGGGGGIRGGGRQLTVRCSGCGRGGRRGTGAVCLRWLSDGEQGGAVAMRGGGGRRGRARGVDALYSRQRQWSRRRKRWAARRWVARLRARCRGSGKAAAAAI